MGLFGLVLGVVGYGLVVAVALGPLLWVWCRERWRRVRARRRPLVLPDGLPVDYAVAVMAAGVQRTWAVAVARLHARGAITLAEGEDSVEITPVPGAQARDDFESRVIGRRRDTGDLDRLVRALVDSDLLRRRDLYTGLRWAPRAMVAAIAVTVGSAAVLIAFTPCLATAFGALFPVIFTAGRPYGLKDLVRRRHGSDRYETTALGRERARALAEGGGAGAAVALHDLFAGYPDRQVAGLFRPPPIPTRPPRGEPDNMGGIGMGM
ncbi:hypothetical protein IOD16_08235 [Saccharothrix sp. 6-C]|uniref:hypothetical protein n=1 Tax=Saccharothrix sp. 6-C TaxID=2781735 RepID=UPI001917700A|nr:hypothetical protein [Saccharothrix sp. 6-C]QQQ78435.1 hypothetical protein IOD16_08235 [Saccharothrix sp. 6-C]